MGCLSSAVNVVVGVYISMSLGRVYVSVLTLMERVTAVWRVIAGDNKQLIAYNERKA